MSIDSSTGVLSAGTASSSTLDGQILETLAGVCDGRSVTVESGTYTLPNVTSTQLTTTSYEDISGSNSILYTSIRNKTSYFKFSFKYVMEQDLVQMKNYNRGLILIRMLIDGTSIDSQIQTH